MALMLQQKTAKLRPIGRCHRNVQLLGESWIIGSRRYFLQQLLLCRRSVITTLLLTSSTIENEHTNNFAHLLITSPKSVLERIAPTTELHKNGRLIPHTPRIMSWRTYKHLAPTGMILLPIVHPHSQCAAQNVPNMRILATVGSCCCFEVFGPGATWVDSDPPGRELVESGGLHGDVAHGFDGQRGEVSFEDFGLGGHFVGLMLMLFYGRVFELSLCYSTAVGRVNS
jgi:hypothetical protein